MDHAWGRLATPESNGPCIWCGAFVGTPGPCLKHPRAEPPPRPVPPSAVVDYRSLGARVAELARARADAHNRGIM